MKTFIDGWNDIEDMKGDFWDKLRYEFNSHEYNNELDGVEWLFGKYSHESYEGSAFVLFKKGEEIFEVSGSHCSCYGLEGQWAPEKTSIETIKHRITQGELGKDNYSKEYNFHEELTKFLTEVA